jgi:hypothetical protein
MGDAAMNLASCAQNGQKSEKIWRNCTRAHREAVLRVEADRDAALLGAAGGGDDLGLDAVRRIDAAGRAVDARQTAAPAERAVVKRR